LAIERSCALDFVHSHVKSVRRSERTSGSDIFVVILSVIAALAISGVDSEFQFHGQYEKLPEGFGAWRLSLRVVNNYMNSSWWATRTWRHLSTVSLPSICRLSIALAHLIV
jgi:hypothetical protein